VPTPAPTPLPTPAPEAPSYAAPPAATAPPPEAAAPTPIPTVPPVPVVPPPSPSMEVAPSAKAAQEARLNAERARRAQAERERLEGEAKRKATEEEAERAAFAERQRRAAALLDQGQPAPTPLPGGAVPTPSPSSDAGRWGPAPTPATAPDGQLPGAAQARRVAPRAATADHAPRPGDLICGSCGAGNDPTRKFCKQCGTTLVEAAVAVRPSWWKRFVAKLKRQPQRQQPGQPSQRTKRRRTQRKMASYVRITMGIIITLGMLVGFGVPSVRGTVLDYYTCRSRQFRAFLKPENKPVLPRTAKAVPSADGFPAGYVIDGFNNTFWQTPPNVADRGKLSVFTIDFGRPVTVRQLGITPGLPAKDGKFQTQPSPSRMQFAWDGDGKKVDTVDLDQAANFQLRKPAKVRKDVSSVVITVLDTYSNTPAPGKENQLAITEIEFFGSPGSGSNEAVTVPKTSIPAGPEVAAPAPPTAAKKKGCHLI
jgi:hypothetical protein